MQRQGTWVIHALFGGGLAIGVAGAVCGLALGAAPGALAAEASRGDRVADHVAALKRRTALPPGYAPVTLAWVAQLPTPELRTAADLAALADVEERAVAVTGYVARLVPVPARLPGRGATLWEFYLHLRVTPPPTCEHYDDPRNVVAVVTPAFQPPRTGWDFDVLADLCRAHTRIRVSGWLLYDPFSQPQVGRSRVSPWSIHPVTHLEVWDPRDQGWNRLP